MYKVKFIAEAQQELSKEILYSKNKWGLKHAKKYYAELKEQINSLKINPLGHPVRDDILPGIRIKPYKGNQIVYFLQKETRLVFILAILSTYQSVDENKLKQRKKAIWKNS